MLGQDVHELALTFVPPLATQHTRDLTERIDSARPLARGRVRGHAQWCSGGGGLDGADDDAWAASDGGEGPLEPEPLWPYGVGVEGERGYAHGKWQLSG